MQTFLNVTFGVMEKRVSFALIIYFLEIQFNSVKNIFKKRFSFASVGNIIFGHESFTLSPKDICFHTLTFQH